MDISIKTYQAGTTAKVSAQEIVRAETSADSSSDSLSPGTAQTVSISNSARALYSLSSSSERQVSMSESDLKALYAKGQKDIYNFGQRIAGGNYNKQDMLPKTDDPDRLASGQKSLDYSIGRSQVPTENLPDPFEGMARNGLSAIVYDDTGTYTDAERYAAYGELSKQDEAYFSTLYANITNGGDNSEVFKGIMDYFDNLPAVEKSAYPDGFRNSIDSLYQEQIEQSGPLALINRSTEEYLEKSFSKGQSSENMLQAVLEKAADLSTAQ
ncbi:hypothetical protein [Pseudomonas sp. AMR01]|uniref:hypothetical protein n=1 Tax=Pseudomonas sp. AMR01 TaxID=3064904 RepID=UPI0035C12FEA